MEVFSEANIESLLWAIVVWLFVSFIVEELCNVLFKWKLYEQWGLNGRGYKTPIIFAIAFLICFYVKIDIFALLMESINITVETGIVSYAVSAALLNGGSGTVYRFLERIREAKKELGQGV